MQIVRSLDTEKLATEFAAQKLREVKIYVSNILYLKYQANKTKVHFINLILYCEYKLKICMTVNRLD